MKDIPEITGMRGLAALSVAGFHAIVVFFFLGPGWPGGITASLLTAGWSGVDFFFVLSGFLLSLPLLSGAGYVRSRKFWTTYMGKRWMRIAPAYYVSIVLALVFANNIAYLWSHPKDVFLHMFYLHSFNSTSFSSIDGVYWTLTLEFQFYLILPLFALLFVGRRWPWALAACFLTSVLWRFATYDAVDGYHGWWLQSQIPGFLFHFAVGIVAARLYLSGWKPPLRSGFLLGALALYFAALFFTFPFPRGGTPGFHPLLEENRFIGSALFQPLLALGFAALILAMTTMKSAVRHAVAWSPAQWLGRTSYSVYLTHVPVGLFMAKATPWTMSQGFLPWLGLNLAIVLAAAGLYYRLVEQPSLALRSRLYPRTLRTPAAPSAPGSQPTTPAQPTTLLPSPHGHGQSPTPAPE